MRREIRLIDKNIIQLIGKRFKSTQKIQALKKRLQIPLFQPKLEQKLIKLYSGLAKRQKVPVSLISSIFRLIFSYSKEPKQTR